MEITNTFIEKYWPLTKVVIKSMPKQGMGGSVGIVESNEGKYTYKISGSWKTALKLDRDLSAYEFLNTKGFPYISQLLKTKLQQRFIQIDDHLVYLIQYIEGDHPSSTPKTYSELGKIVAELHTIKDFPFETDYKPIDAIPSLIQNAEKYSFKDSYINILKSLPDFSQLSIVPIHTEITPGNVIGTASGKLMVIDWDEVGLGPAVLDLGVSLINHFITEDLDVLKDNANAYYLAYFSLRNMNELEKKYIYDAGLFWTCCWISYGDIDKRWKRIQWAIENKNKVEQLYL
jgi:thiamine kinase-like enzyme